MKIENLVDKRLNSEFFPGIVLKVNKNEREIFHYTKGYRQIHPSKEELKTDTLFDLASLTKPLATTPVALTIFEKEKIDLSTTIGKFLPELHPETKEITILQLLTHTSGLPPVPDIYKLFKTESEINTQTALKHLYSLVPEVKPGSSILYSCTGYIFLTRIIMEITGKTLSKLFKDIITQPAEIDSLIFNPSEIEEENTAATEYCKWRARWIKGEVHDENSFCLDGEGGNAGLFGNAEGIMKLLTIFTNNGTMGKHQILSPDVCSKMTNCQTGKIHPRRAAGFLMQDTDSFAGNIFSTKAYGHTGFTGTSVWVDPVKDISIVCLTNRVHFGREKTAETIKQFRKELHSLIYKKFC